MSDETRPGDPSDEKTDDAEQKKPKILVFGPNATDQEVADAINAMDER